MWQFFLRWLIASCFSLAAVPFTGGTGEPTAQNLALVVQESDPVPSPLSTTTPFSSPQSLQSAVPVSTVSAPSPKADSSTGEEKKEEAEQAAMTEKSVEYIIQPDDVLQITVYEEPDLSTKSRVAGSGEINFPLLGRVQATGLSVIQLQEKLEGLLGQDYLVNPQIQVFIETYHARNVFVTGAVNKPGSYPLPTGKPTTLMEAIAMAGGFGDEAAVNSTRIIRIENGKETTIRVPANDIIKRGDKSKDVEVRPGDVIFVPESFF